VAKSGVFKPAYGMGGAAADLPRLVAGRPSPAHRRGHGHQQAAERKGTESVAATSEDLKEARILRLLTWLRWQACVAAAAVQRLGVCERSRAGESTGACVLLGECV
jgi:hypothetical protein